jgi:hypothetical protein
VSRLFISHASVDNAAAAALHLWLCEQGFDDVFLDIDAERGLVSGRALARGAEGGCPSV